MTNREQIVALRGDYISKPLYTHGNLAVVMVGFEHYPDPSGYYIAKDKVPVTDTTYDVVELFDVEWDLATVSESDMQGLNLGFNMAQGKHNRW